MNDITGAAVVVVAGRYLNRPGVVLEGTGATVTVLLHGVGAVRVRRSSLDLY